MVRILLKSPGRNHKLLPALATDIPRHIVLTRRPQVAITDCSPLWLKTCHRHVFLTRRALALSVSVRRDSAAFMPLSRLAITPICVIIFLANTPYGAPSDRGRKVSRPLFLGTIRSTEIMTLAMLAIPSHLRCSLRTPIRIKMCVLCQMTHNKSS